MRWGKDKMVTGCVPADDGLLSSCHCSCAPPFCPGVRSGISAELSAPFTVLFSSVEKVPSERATMPTIATCQVADEMVPDLVVRFTNNVVVRAGFSYKELNSRKIPAR